MPYKPISPNPEGGEKEKSEPFPFSPFSLEVNYLFPIVHNLFPDWISEWIKEIERSMEEETDYSEGTTNAHQLRNSALKAEPEAEAEREDQIQTDPISAKDAAGYAIGAGTTYFHAHVKPHPLPSERSRPKHFEGAQEELVFTELVCGPTGQVLGEKEIRLKPEDFKPVNSTVIRCSKCNGGLVEHITADGKWRLRYCTTCGAETKEEVGKSASLSAAAPAPFYDKETDSVVSPLTMQDQDLYNDQND